MKSGLLALAIAGALPMAAFASSPAANDPSFIAEINAAYGTSFHASQGRATSPVQQSGAQAPAQNQN